MASRTAEKRKAAAAHAERAERQGPAKVGADGLTRGQRKKKARQERTFDDFFFVIGKGRMEGMISQKEADLIGASSRDLEVIREQMKLLPTDGLRHMSLRIEQSRQAKAQLQRANHIWVQGAQGRMHAHYISLGWATEENVADVVGDAIRTGHDHLDNY